MTASSRVLVIGAGPTGLTIALELARRGVPVRIIDKAHTPNTETRALGMQARTLELFERSGLVEKLVRSGLRANLFNVFSEGRQILRADFRGLESAYPFLLMIPQHEVERILADALAAHGVEVERGVSLSEFTQSPDDVEATLVHPDGTTERTGSDFLVGADGAHSTVRKHLDLGFVGTSFDEKFIVADLRVDWDRAHDQFFAFLDRGRFMAFFPMPERWHRVAIARPSDDPASGEVTREELQRSMDDCVPGGTRIVEVREAGRFAINQRRASSPMVGRVFLAGDAAHIHSVVGAQGMNTGIQDSFNLGWKLAAVIQDGADRAVLTSYAEERAPVAARLVKGTRRVTRLTLLSDPVRTWLRRHVARRIVGSPKVQARLTRAIAQLDISYHDRTGAAPADRAEIGDRAPDTSLHDTDGATRLLSLLDDRRHTLLCVDVPPSSVHELLDRYGPVVAAVHLANEPEVRRRYGLTGPGVILVRPDGYIAARAASAELEPLLAYLDRVFVGDGVRSE